MYKSLESRKKVDMIIQRQQNKCDWGKKMASQSYVLSKHDAVLVISAVL